MDQVGTLARNVDDAALLLSIVSGQDHHDATSLPLHFELNEWSPRPLTIGIPKEYLGQACQASILEAVELTIDIARALGWKVREVSLPLTNYALWIYYIIASVEAASNLARYDGVKYGFRPYTADSYDDMVVRSRTEGFGDEAKRRIMLGTFAASAGYHDKYYGRACEARAMLIDEFAEIFRSVDVLLSPISPTVAWKLGSKTRDPMEMYLSDIHSVPAALGGVPAMVIPVMDDNDGLPVPIQLTGPHGGEGRIIAAAKALEAALSYGPSASKASRAT
jgi:aspartyl-tRNA(Asn)/glutamyl-tRNA(Gln) amidotransferase subunit A